MSRCLIFSGTTEGRELAERLCRAGVQCTVSVATAYGEQVMQPQEGLTVHRGRLNQQEMQQFIWQGAYDAVVDATHPYATVVSEQIRYCMSGSRIPFFRLKRNCTVNYNREWAQMTFFDSHVACAAELEKSSGNILLTTGSKELRVYAAQEKLRERLFVRVLPSEESIATCRENGLQGRQILAMQGPFSTELNLALMRHFQIQVLVTKESGKTGGFLEKQAAAEELGIPMFVIGQPTEEEGESPEEVWEKLADIFSLSKDAATEQMKISIIGMGMGNPALLTKEAKAQLEAAELVTGAPRLVDAAKESGISQEKIYTKRYLPRDVIPLLQVARKKKVAILYSGDTGLYSGATQMYEELKKAKKERKLEAEVQIYPGISSVTYLAAKLGVSWQDAAIVSIHGRKADVESVVRTHEKTFVLLSGEEDLQKLGTFFCGKKEIRIYVGYQLSYPEETVECLTPEECCLKQTKGLYICMIVNPLAKAKTELPRVLTPGISDHAFLRGNVPMTKEEIRTISVCKLKLAPDSVVYDIGSGTGSVSVECARLSPQITVYSIEKKEEAVRLTQENANHFQIPNLHIVEGEAPDVLEELVPATHAFIGGSSGKLMEIIETLWKKNKNMRIVLNVVTLEHLAKISELFSDPSLNVDLIQVQVHRSGALGRYHSLRAENPVYIITLSRKGE
ncbi:MAG: precorrin-6A reductase [Lachnospiraceae bacterium]